MPKGKPVDKAEAAMPLKPLVVSERADGTMLLLSDVNNFKAAKRLRLSEMPAYVLRDLTLEQEAQLSSWLHLRSRYSDRQAKDSSG